MPDPSAEKPYDLEERTFQFAKAVRLFVKTLPKTIANQNDGRQLIRASGSVGANYREANETIGFFSCLEFRNCDLEFIWNLDIVIWNFQFIIPGSTIRIHRRNP